MVYDYYKEKNARIKKGGFKSLIFLVLLFVTFSIGTGIYLEYLQYKEIGNFTSVFTTNLKYKVFFSIITFLIIFTVIFITNLFIRKNYKVYFLQNPTEMKRFLNIPLALLIGIIGALLTKEFFFNKALMFLNSVPFNLTSPLFGYDIGYFIFTRPFLLSIYGFISALWFFVIVYTFAYYFILASMSAGEIAQGTINFQNLKFKPFLRHNVVNIVIYFLIKAFSFKFQKESILYGTFENYTGAGYLDVNVWLKFYKIAPYLLIGIVLASVFLISKNKIKTALLTIALYPMTWLIVGIIATLVQSFFVKPNVVAYETPFLKNNINTTRTAYNLDKIQVVDFGQIKELTPQILNNNIETKNDIRIVDYKSTLDSNKQLQAITNFYAFNDGDIVSTNINGKITPVFITAREIEKKKLPENSYLSRTFRYTHGYGVAMNPINRVTPQGQVDFLIGDLNDNRNKLKTPGIYYGELTSDYVLVNAANGLTEFDYDGSVPSRYQGTGGINMSFLNRVLFAFKYTDIDMLISSYVNKDTKLLLNRQILARAQKVLPFLDIDTDPYIMVGDDGRLKWIIDAYTSTNNYPYSENNYINGIGYVNYIRNSAKIIMDAYDGSMKCYIVDQNDPIIKVYQKIYPNAFTNEPLPEDAKKYMKYPEMLFNLQTNMLKNYHLTENDVDQFFSNSNLWDISKHFSGEDTTDGTNTKTDIESFYNMIKLPSGIGKTEEFILMRPFSPSGDRHNMTAWLAARNSYEDYGKMFLFKFAQNTNVLGPYQIAVKINQNPDISSLMTLWGQSGTSAYKGNLMVLPMEESILYVEPIYIRATVQSSIPEIRKIVVAYQKGDEVVIGLGDNLDAALNDLFTRKGVPSKQSYDGTGASTSKTDQTTQSANTQQPAQTSQTTEPQTAQSLVNEIATKYESMQKQMNDLGKLLEQLKQKP